MNLQSLNSIINQVRANKGLLEIPGIRSSMRLREDLEFESLDLAELTVRIDEAFGVDVFSDGMVATVGEIEEKIVRRVRR